MCSHGLKDPLAAALRQRVPGRQGHCCLSCSHSQMEGRHHSLTLQMCRLSWDSEFSRFRTLTHTASAGMAVLLCISWRRSGPMLWRWDGKVWSHLYGFRCWPCLRRNRPSAGPRCLDHGSLYTKVYFVLKLLAFFVCFLNWPCRNGNFLIFVLISSTQQSILHNESFSRCLIKKRINKLGLSSQLSQVLITQYIDWVA